MACKSGEVGTRCSNIPSHSLRLLPGKIARKVSRSSIRHFRFYLSIQPRFLTPLYLKLFLFCVAARGRLAADLGGIRMCRTEERHRSCEGFRCVCFACTDVCSHLPSTQVVKRRWQSASARICRPYPSFHLCPAGSRGIPSHRPDPQLSLLAFDRTAGKQGDDRWISRDLGQIRDVVSFVSMGGTTSFFLCWWIRDRPMNRSETPRRSIHSRSTRFGFEGWRRKGRNPGSNRHGFLSKTPRPGCRKCHPFLAPLDQGGPLDRPT